MSYLSHAFMNVRKIHRILPAQKVNMGGQILDQPLPFEGLDQIDPFLLIHHWKDELPGGDHPRDLGVGPHPHRGFSPVTIIIEGEIEHRDSRRNRSIVGAGGVQWMNAGMGIIHSERPSAKLAREGGPMELIQIWINTPAALKMRQPSYYPLSKQEIPVFTSDNGLASVQVISGELHGIRSPFIATPPVLMLRGTFKEGAHLDIPIPYGFHCILYQLDGRIEINGELTTHIKNMTWFENDGDTISLKAEKDSEFIVLASAPLNEPVAKQGPFVMSDQTEVMRAMRDYQMGKMGFLVAEF